VQLVANEYVLMNMCTWLLEGARGGAQRQSVVSWPLLNGQVGLVAAGD